MARLTHDDIGAWLFTCNPKQWDIESALRDGYEIDSWRVRPSYRVDLIQPGDLAIIWVTGPAKAASRPGIWAIGHTTGEVGQDDHGDEYWLDAQRGDEPATYAGLAMKAINQVIPRERIAAEPATHDLEVLRQPQMSNPSYLTHAQLAGVAEMVGPWPAYGGEGRLSSLVKPLVSSIRRVAHR